MVLYRKSNIFDNRVVSFIIIGFGFVGVYVIR